jgi:hypothetical protein
MKEYSILVRHTALPCAMTCHKACHYYIVFWQAVKIALPRRASSPPTIKTETVKITAFENTLRQSDYKARLRKWYF